MFRTYSEISEGEALLFKALERIAAAKGCRPGFPDYLTKDGMAITAERAIAEFIEHRKG